ncbi:endo-1,4-beta-xylanase [Kitasatospora sp. NPDC059747]|uniref:endo-1,4-beta-xylanase n=1 Tax=Kitasatospora sp. NPDC059747 TaxID=3346930 RepID=UPI00364DB556
MPLGKILIRIHHTWAAVVVLALVLAAGVTAATPPATAAGGTLKAAAQADGRYFGTALTDGDLGVGGETAVAGAQFDMLTPGNEMKWDTTEPAAGSYDFGPGDQLVQFARAHGMRVRGHNLVWQNQLPSWVSNLPLSQVRSAMEAHITTEATHYKGQVYAWDVINEPFNGDGSLVPDVFYRAMGTDYLADALRTAHAADPGAKLSALGGSSTGGGGGTTGELHAVGAGKCLDVPNSLTAAGTQVQIYSCWGGTNQIWTHTSADQLSVYGGAGRMCLDASAQGTGSGTKVVV